MLTLLFNDNILLYYQLHIAILFGNAVQRSKVSARFQVNGRYKRVKPPVAQIKQETPSTFAAVCNFSALNILLSRVFMFSSVYINIIN